LLNTKLNLEQFMYCAFQIDFFNLDFVEYKLATCHLGSTT
jgi:hypothetical protein